MIDCYVNQVHAMRRKIQFGICTFDEIEICKKLVIGAFILKITGFAAIKVLVLILFWLRLGTQLLACGIQDSTRRQMKITYTWQVAHMFCWVYYKDFYDRLCWRYVGKSVVSYNIEIDNNRRKETNLVIKDLKQISLQI